MNVHMWRAESTVEALATLRARGAVIVEPEFDELPVPTLRIVNPYHAFSRTLGWASGIEFAGTSAYVPADYYGTYRLDLNAPGNL